MKKLDNEEELKKSTKLHKDSSQGHYRNSAQINDESVFQEPVACPSTIHVSQQSLNNLDQEPPFPQNEVTPTADQDGPGAVKIATTAFAAVKNATTTFEDVLDSFSTASTPFFSSKPRKLYADNQNTGVVNEGNLGNYSVNDTDQINRMGASGGYGQGLEINSSEEDLSHPPGFSNQCFSFSENNQSNTGGIEKNNSFLEELQKTIAVGEALGYNMDGCMDHVIEILQGHVQRQVPK
ncbi:unnamed protein product [Lactuca saligna]|uniref:Uncharacterized protein n=1 Tax=Lactuca saligna TaxID=75948 RepID=A0AA35YQ67_LACSI|nr:unnamed protein product [Lactuca saligna]